MWYPASCSSMTPRGAPGSIEHHRRLLQTGRVHYHIVPNFSTSVDRNLSVVEIISCEPRIAPSGSR